MPAWLMLILIVLLSVALFADHRRNTANELTTSDLDSLETRKRPLRPWAHRARADGRPASAAGARRPRTVRLTRNGQATRRR
jgi:hypothetical protein